MSPLTPPTAHRADAAPPLVLVCATGMAHLELVMDALCERLAAQGQALERIGSPAAFAQAHPERFARASAIAGFGSMRIGADLMAQAPGLRGIVSCVSGTDGIDVDAATAAGVLVAHAPTEANVRSMAEATVMLMLNLVYDLDGTRETARLGRPRPLLLPARMLQGCTVGLVGWGRISAMVAALLQPFGVRLLVYSRRGRPHDLPAQAEPAALAALMAEADVVCVLAGVVAGAPPLITRELMARMKPTACFINVARGAAVDEAALAEALQAGRIARAALDVFQQEPLPADSPLWACANCTITPHQVGHTRETDASLPPALIANVLALLAGQLPPMLRNPQAGPAWLRRWSGRRGAAG